MFFFNNEIFLGSGSNANTFPVGPTNFAKIMFVYPPRERVTATTNLVGENAFSQIDMSDELLSKVRRSNKQIIESEGTGVVMARSN